MKRRIITILLLIILGTSQARAKDTTKDDTKVTHYTPIDYPSATQALPKCYPSNNETCSANYVHTYYIPDAITTEELELIRATCYLPTGNRTASGVYPYEGIIASNRAHLGQVAALYSIDMEFIGYFECRDTGGHIGLKNGTRIDVYRDNRARLKEWVNTYGDYVYIKWIDAE